MHDHKGRRCEFHCDASVTLIAVANESQTADRAGFLIRTEAAYRDVWDAYRPAGRARLLFAQSADGEPLATPLRTMFHMP